MRSRQPSSPVPALRVKRVSPPPLPASPPAPPQARRVLPLTPRASPPPPPLGRRAVPTPPPQVGRVVPLVPTTPAAPIQASRVRPAIPEHPPAPPPAQQPQGRLRASSEVQLRGAVLEILESERIYVDEICLLVGFLTTIVDEGGGCGLLPDDAKPITKFTDNAKSIHSFHCGLLQELEARVGDLNRVGALFLSRAAFLGLYKEYCKNHKSILVHINYCKGRSELFRTFMRGIEAGYKDKKQVASLLIKPVQRLGQYVLMFNTIVENVGIGDHRRTLEQACKLMADKAMDVNEGLRKAENHQVMLQFSERLKGFGEEVMQPHRAFLFEGDVTKEGRRQHAILFSDYLVFVDPASYQTEARALLEEVRVKDFPVGQRAFQVVDASRVHTAKCETYEEATKFSETIRQAVALTHEKARSRERARARERSDAELPEAPHEVVKNTQCATASLRKCLVHITAAEVHRDSPKGPQTTWFTLQVTTEHGHSFKFHRSQPHFVHFHKRLSKPCQSLQEIRVRDNGHFDRAQELQLELDHFLQTLVLRPDMQTPMPRQDMQTPVSRQDMQQSQALHEFLALGWVNAAGRAMCAPFPDAHRTVEVELAVSCFEVQIKESTRADALLERVRNQRGLLGDLAVGLAVETEPGRLVFLENKDVVWAFLCDFPSTKRPRGHRRVLLRERD